MYSPRYAVRLSYRSAHGWGYEVARIREDGRGEAMGTWHAAREEALRQLDVLELAHCGSTLRHRVECGAD